MVSFVRGSRRFTDRNLKTSSKQGFLFSLASLLLCWCCFSASPSIHFFGLCPRRLCDSSSRRRTAALMRGVFGNEVCCLQATFCQSDTALDKCVSVSVCFLHVCVLLTVSSCLCVCVYVSVQPCENVNRFCAHGQLPDISDL